MEEQKTVGTVGVEAAQPEVGRKMFSFANIYATIVLNWKWFILSLIICLGLAAIYLRYATPMYQAYAKLLIKEESSGRSRSVLQSMTNFGTISNSQGIDNEMEIISSHTIATAAVRDLKLYATYTMEGRVKDNLIYKTQPVNVDIDPDHLEALGGPINMTIERDGNNYKVSGTYYAVDEVEGVTGPYSMNKTFTTLPQTFRTRAGDITFSQNSGFKMNSGQKMFVRITTPATAAYKYRAALSVAPTSRSTTIARLVMTDEIPQRARDYLKQLAICYNRDANDDKNIVARRTEEFINDRLEKINAELGETEGQLEEYKRRHHMVELRMNASQAVTNANDYEQKLAEANTQVALLNSISDYMNEPANRYQTLASNVGLTDATASSLINRYNEIVLQRNRLLQSASEESPSVQPLTAQLDDLSNSIRRAMTQSRHNMEIRRSGVAQQYNQYSGQISATPEQERMLNQIGRQQEVRSGLYLMLLQKREENSISLAATADKGKLIDEPEGGTKISPKSSSIMMGALLAGLLIPTLILFLIEFFRYKIEGHDDVAKLTNLPIIADVAVASETAKTKADIVVHENQNNQMEEIFRSMRTNLQFMLEEGQKVVMFTSSTSGEGKTFNCANLAVSFALLDKKVVLVGLDIRKPRLAELFELDDHKHGITPLLSMHDPKLEDVKAQILPSGINDNLDLLLAGPIPPNPTELMSRPSLDKVINILREQYDYVLIDTAPVGLVTDTMQIGRVADATVYMCRADYTPRSSFDLINSLASEKKLPNMSIVINGIDMSKKKYGYYYGYGKYGKYGRYGRYGTYGKYGRYGGYGQYGSYGSYGNYSNSHYGNKNDNSVKH